MYQPKQKSYGIIAVIYYCIYLEGLFLAEILYQKGIRVGMNITILNKYVIFIIGALLFSFMHIPFQMFVHNNVSLHYLVVAMIF